MAIPLFLLAALALAFRMASGTNHHQNGTAKPNFIFIMTDDQDLHLNSLEYQNIVQKQLIEKGTIFKKHFCTVALCCPSRVSLLTGKAAHNTNVTDVSWVRPNLSDLSGRRLSLYHRLINNVNHSHMVCSITC